MNMKLWGAAACAFAIVTPASAARVIEGKPYNPVGDIAQNEVHNGGGDQDSTTIAAFLKDSPNIDFFFRSTDNLEATGAGHATVTGDTDGGVAGFDSIDLVIENGFTFDAIEFNLDGINETEPFEAQVFFSLVGSESFTALDNTITVGTGSNFALVAGEGQFFDAIRLTALGTGRFNLIRQVDVRAQAAGVPEPATWAMFLMGFGAVGYSMRSRKVGYKALQAV
jgi:hypothetical protein